MMRVVYILVVMAMLCTACGQEDLPVLDKTKTDPRFTEVGPQKDAAAKGDKTKQMVDKIVEDAKKEGLLPDNL